MLTWDIAAGGTATLWQDVTAPPREYQTRWDDGEGDLYVPAGETRAAMVLVPGAAVLGRDETRLKALARTFARAGFRRSPGSASATPVPTSSPWPRRLGRRDGLSWRWSTTATLTR